MTILILSDSHGHADLIREAVERVKPDALLFAGDGLRDLSSLDLSCPLYAVRGNCDWQTEAFSSGVSDEELITLGGIRIFLCHGHRYGVKSSIVAAAAAAVRQKADVLVFGHTHEAAELNIGPDDTGLTAGRSLLVCNPGTIGLYPHTFGVLTVRGGSCLFSSGSRSAGSGSSSAEDGRRGLPNRHSSRGGRHRSRI